MSGTLWKEPREFRCLKGAWDNPVTANTPEDARVLFLCEACSLFPSQCKGLGNPDMDGKLKDEIRMALRQLSRTPPKRRSSGTRKLVEEHYDDIRAALDAGHGYTAIAKTLTRLGIKAASSTIAKHCRDLAAEKEEKVRRAEKGSR